MKEWIRRTLEKLGFLRKKSDELDPVAVAEYSQYIKEMYDEVYKRLEQETIQRYGSAAGFSVSFCPQRPHDGSMYCAPFRRTKVRCRIRRRKPQ